MLTVLTLAWRFVKGCSTEEEVKSEEKNSFTPILYQPYLFVNKWPPGQVGDSQPKMQLYNYFHSAIHRHCVSPVKEEKDAMFNKAKYKTKQHTVQ